VKEWVRDVTSKYGDPSLKITWNELVLANPENRWELLDRDACFLCENIFFAEGRGIEVEGDILNILREENPSACEYYVFGKGKFLRGWWEKLEGHRAEIFVREVKKRSASFQ